MADHDETLVTTARGKETLQAINARLPVFERCQVGERVRFYSCRTQSFSQQHRRQRASHAIHQDFMRRWH